ncbi:YbaK/EbsC family protein [Allosaccharopolyspora coralli]|uniref:YbaK/EbsC family protein n=1 Tax=Allosaccharopolyspora coralli TaxID=2665642 RepID=A0A5Q3Q7K9_9PSEU|nr:YbaK/EbsC family protein [Allosaccharopolyspora coralli]QGK70651.1 YbaK/EbsC family protein [Allosaccharopolyspora coralli]
MSVGRRARQFQNRLGEMGLDLEVVEMPDSTRTAADAARALNCEQAQIVKSLVFRTEPGDAPVLVLVSGVNRVDEAALSRVLGTNLAKADAAYVKKVTGFSIGGVPPLGHSSSMTLLVDEDLLRFDATWAAAGSPNAVFRIPGRVTDFLPPHTVGPVR